MPNLQRISYREDAQFRPAQTAAEFWAEYDAPGAAERREAEEKLEISLGRKATKTADGTLELDLQNQKLHDLTALKGLKISTLKLRDTDISDLSPLTGMPLRRLYLAHSAVRDLSPLRGLPLELLHCDNTPVTDLRPLLDMPKLRNVFIPRAATNIEVLRPLTNLEYIGWEDDWLGVTDDPVHSRLTRAEFWQRYDAQQTAGEK